MPERRPTWAQIRQFCRAQRFRAATTDHDFYDKRLPDGSTAGTKISLGVTETDPVSSSLWPRIWKRQLRLRSEADFWSGLEGGPVAYDIPPMPEAAEPLPPYLLRHLTHDRRLSDDEIARTTRDEAQRLLNEWYSREHSG